jgi:hypothetical protein
MTEHQIADYIARHVNPNASVGATTRQVREARAYLSEFIDERKAVELMLSHIRQ